MPVMLLPRIYILTRSILRMRRVHVTPPPYLYKGTVELPRGTMRGEYFTLELTKPHIRKRRTVTTDNWLSSLPLALKLRKRGMEFVGPIREKPHLPKELLTMKLEKGNSVGAYNYNKNVSFLCH